MKKYTNLASEAIVLKTKKALENNGFRVHVVDSKTKAREKFLEIVPKGSVVMENTSQTLKQTGISGAIDNPDKYISLHKKAVNMDREKYRKEILALRTTPDWAVGSFHALTYDGKIMLASGSGSQVPGYAYGADNVVFVAGTHKIVKNIDEGFDRIYNHALPLESERINRVYKTTAGSNPRRILIINSEADNKRTNIILVKEALGF